MKIARINAGLLALGAICSLAGSASGAVNPQKAKILLHVKATATKNQCSLTPLANDCSLAKVKGNLYPALYHMQVIIDHGDSMATVIANDATNGLAGLQFGVQYPPHVGDAGIGVFSWTNSATLEFVSLGFPANGGGNLITWDTTGSCQRNRLSCAGYFYMGAYGPSTFHLVKRQVDNKAAVADCSAKEIALELGNLGFAAFSAGEATQGCNPCLDDCAPVAVSPTTWSKVKSLLN